MVFDAAIAPFLTCSVDSFLSTRQCDSASSACVHSEVYVMQDCFKHVAPEKKNDLLICFGNICQFKQWLTFCAPTVWDLGMSMEVYFDWDHFDTSRLLEEVLCVLQQSDGIEY